MDFVSSISGKSLEQFCANIFVSLGVQPDYAKIAARSVVEADLRGIRSHGILRFPIYIKRMELGLIESKAEPKVVSRKGAVSLFDGKHGMGQVTGYLAMQQAVASAKEYGIGAAGVYNSTHFGFLAYYSNIAAANGMIGMAFSNTTPLMAPTGGAQRVIGNNPISISVPYGGNGPVILDMACSTVALGKVQYAAQEGQEIPGGWGMDQNGHVTNNPQEVIDGGLLGPIGSYKGYGLAFIIEVLSGVLTGAGLGVGVRSLYQDLVNKQDTGHFMIALDVAPFMDKEQFYGRLTGFIKQMKTAKQVPGERIYIPGEIENDIFKEREEKGIPLTAKNIEALQELAAKYNLELPLA